MNDRIKVLFIDDDESTRRVYASKLAMSGFVALMAANPEEAIAILENEKVSMIVTDLIMPKYSGVDLIQAVRECPYTRNIPILGFTSGGNMALVEKAGMAGANEILNKYTTPPAVLIEKIKEILKASAVKPTA